MSSSIEFNEIGRAGLRIEVPLERAVEDVAAALRAFGQSRGLSESAAEALASVVRPGGRCPLVTPRAVIFDVDALAEGRIPPRIEGRIAARGQTPLALSGRGFVLLVEREGRVNVNGEAALFWSASAVFPESTPVPGVIALRYGRVGDSIQAQVARSLYTYRDRVTGALVEVLHAPGIAAFLPYAARAVALAYGPEAAARIPEWTAPGQGDGQAAAQRVRAATPYAATTIAGDPFVG